MTLNVALLIVLLVRLGWAAMEMLLASFWEDGVNAFAPQGQSEARDAQNGTS